MNDNLSALLKDWADYLENREKEGDAGYSRHHIRCYSLIGHDMEKEEARNREIWNAGATPFSQLERDFSRKKRSTAKSGATFSAFGRGPQRCGGT